MLSAVFLAATLAGASAFALPQGSGGLAVRDTPSYCSFEGNRGDFAYVDETSVESTGTACFGWQLGTVACSAWSQDEQDDMYNALNQQIAKDGQFETSTVGSWTANFAIGTTAFGDRSIVIPVHEIQRVNGDGVSQGDGAGSLTYYWGRDGNIMALSRSTC